MVFLPDYWDLLIGRLLSSNVAERIYLTEGKKATKLNSLHIFGAFPWHHWNGWILTRIQSHEKKKEISAESDALDVQ